MSYRVLKEKEVKIKKERQCFFCLRKFEPQSKLIYNVSIHEGYFQTCYFCRTCDSILNSVEFINGVDVKGEGCVNELLNHYIHEKSLLINTYEKLDLHLKTQVKTIILSS